MNWTPCLNFVTVEQWSFWQPRGLASGSVRIMTRENYC